MKTYSTNKEFDETKYKYKSKNLVKNGNIAFLTSMPGDINKIAVDVNALAKQTNSISNNLIIKYYLFYLTIISNSSLIGIVNIP